MVEQENNGQCVEQQPGEKRQEAQKHLTSPLLMALPARVASRYQEACLVQHLSPTACAMLIGSTLEAICTYEQITGASLPEKLSLLAQRRRLPTPLVDIAHALRALRNIGSHEADEMIEPLDVPHLLAGIEALLSYLYLLPRQSAALEERLQHHLNERRGKGLEQRL